MNPHGGEERAYRIYAESIGVSDPVTTTAASRPTSPTTT